SEGGPRSRLRPPAGRHLLFFDRVRPAARRAIRPAGPAGDAPRAGTEPRLVRRQPAALGLRDARRPGAVPTAGLSAQLSGTRPAGADRLPADGTLDGGCETHPLDGL